VLRFFENATGATGGASRTTPAPATPPLSTPATPPPAPVDTAPVAERADGENAGR